MNHENHVPPQIRSALSKASNAPGIEISNVRPASNYEGAMIEVSKVRNLFRGALERNGASLGSVIPNGDDSVEVHVHLD